MRLPALPTLVAAAALIVSTTPTAGALAVVDKSDNVELVASFDFEGSALTESGSDIAFSGKYAYVGDIGSSGGVHVFDLSKKVAREVGFLDCPGEQNDVEVVRPGLLALGYHRNECGVPTGGVSLVDVSRPRKPRMISTLPLPSGTVGVHTLTDYPGEPLLYLSPGGWDQELAEMKSHEVIVDVSNPRRPKVVATFDPAGAGCHDLSFHVTQGSKLAFCAGDSTTQIWDVSDPLKPVTLSTITNPFITPLVAMHHSAVASDDGRLLAISDEASPSECVGGTTGSIWIYDIARPDLPTLAGRYDLPRGPDPTGGYEYGCSAHNIAFVPDRHILVAAWYWGGMNVLDLSNPALPTEVAHYMDDERSYWSAYYYEGFVYASGVPGLDVLEVSDLS